MVAKIEIVNSLITLHLPPSLPPSQAQLIYTVLSMPLATLSFSWMPTFLITWVFHISFSTLFYHFGFGLLLCVPSLYFFLPVSSQSSFRSSLQSKRRVTLILCLGRVMRLVVECTVGTFVEKSLGLSQ